MHSGISGDVILPLLVLAKANRLFPLPNLKSKITVLVSFKFGYSKVYFWGQTD